MSTELSRNARAILLLTAPLIVGRERSSTRPLSPGEYKRLARRLVQHQSEPADLLGSGAGALLEECRPDLDVARLEQLLGRGLVLSQALERWQARAIWVVSRADSGYPQRFKKRLGEDAPPVIYGCGDPSILDSGGLAVVGSRHVDHELVEHTETVGRLAADAQRTVVSGGAKGIDQAAMRGALDQGGRVVGILADGLEKAAMNREHRELLMDERLVLVSPYDPSARFHVGHAMQRNKLIYAIADVALVVSSDFEKGGTWAGATEQLERYRFVPIYTRSTGTLGKGLDALIQKGAKPWPNPSDPDEFEQLLNAPVHLQNTQPEQVSLLASSREEPADSAAIPVEETPAPADASRASSDPMNPADALFAKVKQLLEEIDTPVTEADVSDCLQVSKSQARAWLQRLVKEGVLEKFTKPVRYSPRRATPALPLDPQP